MRLDDREYNIHGGLVARGPGALAACIGHPRWRTGCGQPG
jgi:hypothetical protein